jgi:hypothetical protein
MILPLLAPLLATLAQNGLGMLADAVTKKGQQVVEDTLGIDLSQDPDPATITQWKIAAQEHGKALLAMAYGDRADARAREMQISISENAPLLNKLVTPLLGLGVVILSFILFTVLIFVDVRPEAKDILIYILGVLSAAVTQILSYYFGSSMCSKDKGDELKAMSGTK